MTNEELAVLAKTNNDALAELWGQNTGLAGIFATRRFARLQEYGNTCGTEIDDLKQTAFLGLVRAVHYFEPDKGLKFNTYWDNCVKYEFNRLLGTHTTSKREPLNICTSLDAPVSDDADADTLMDFIADPIDVYTEIDERMSRSEMLQKSMKMLSEKQQRALQLIFYKNMTRKQAATTMGITERALEILEHTAIFALRRSLKVGMC